MESNYLGGRCPCGNYSGLIVWGDPRGNFMAVIVWGQLSVGNCH